MRHCPLWHLLCWSVFASLGCRSAELPGLAPSALGSDPEGCRSFATLGGVDVGAGTGELRCHFDVDTAEHRCDVSVAGQLASSVTEYASVADFVEAGHTLGKRTSLVETRVEGGHTRRLSYRYDELGRLVRSVDETPASTIVTAYSDHDELGRPRRAASESGADGDCGRWLEDIEYADGLRTVSSRSRLRDPAHCGFALRTLVERFDGAGNRVSATVADATGIGDSFVARHPTAIDRVCL